jgi:hypothetical protein
VGVIPTNPIRWNLDNSKLHDVWILELVLNRGKPTYNELHFIFEGNIVLLSIQKIMSFGRKS